MRPCATLRRFRKLESAEVIFIFKKKEKKKRKSLNNQREEKQNSQEEKKKKKGLKLVYEPVISNTTPLNNSFIDIFIYLYI